MKFIDTHIHLQDYKTRYTTDILAAAAAAGVEKFVCCGTSPADWDDVAGLYRRFPEKIIPAFGLHPWHINRAEDDWPEKLENLLQTYPQALVGECGLDRHKNPDEEPQTEIFRRQTALAVKYNRPLIIHAVKSQMFFEHLWPELPPRFVFHSFAGSVDFLRQIIRKGGYVSFSFSIRRQKTADELIKEVPLARLLLESDGPYQSPEPESETRPEDLPGLAAFIAARRPETETELLKNLYQNSEEFIHVGKQ